MDNDELLKDLKEYIVSEFERELKISSILADALLNDKPIKAKICMPPKEEILGGKE